MPLPALHLTPLARPPRPPSRSLLVCDDWLWWAAVHLSSGDVAHRKADSAAAEAALEASPSWYPLPTALLRVEVRKLRPAQQREFEYVGLCTMAK